MIRVMLVDDQARELEGMRSIIRWEEMDMQVVQAAADARDAQGPDPSRPGRAFAPLQRGESPRRRLDAAPRPCHVERVRPTETFPLRNKRPSRNILQEAPCRAYSILSLQSCSC